MTKSNPAVRFNFIHGVFDAPLHAMAIALDRVKRDLVLFAPPDQDTHIKKIKTLDDSTLARIFVRR